MGYDKQTWQTGDTVTADKLNHMEEGIAGAFNYPEPPEPPEPTPPSVQFIKYEDVGNWTFNTIRGLISSAVFPVLLVEQEEGKGLIAMPYLYSGHQGESAVVVAFGDAAENFTANGDTADSPLYFD